MKFETVREIRRQRHSSYSANMRDTMQLQRNRGFVFDLMVSKKQSKARDSASTVVRTTRSTRSADRSPYARRVTRSNGKATAAIEPDNGSGQSQPPSRRRTQNNRAACNGKQLDAISDLSSRGTQASTSNDNDTVRSRVATPKLEALDSDEDGGKTSFNTLSPLSIPSLLHLLMNIHLLPSTWLDEVLVSIERQRGNLVSELRDAEVDVKDALAESFKALVAVKELVGPQGLSGLERALASLEAGDAEAMVGPEMVKKMLTDARDTAAGDDFEEDEQVGEEWLRLMFMGTWCGKSESR
ncbi:oxidation resistance protein [Salix suchowensis]|nr:oxidation resistance protein [Salix suchowensis]